MVHKGVGGQKSPEKTVQVYEWPLTLPCKLLYTVKEKKKIVHKNEDIWVPQKRIFYFKSQAELLTGIWQ